MTDRKAMACDAGIRAKATLYKGAGMDDACCDKVPGCKGSLSVPTCVCCVCEMLDTSSVMTLCGIFLLIENKQR